MKFINYLDGDIKKIGISFNSEKVYSMDKISETLNMKNPKDMTELIVMWNDNINEITSNILSNIENIESCGKIKDLNLLAPIEYPIRNVICLGKNYLDHCLEMEGKTSDLIDVPKKPIYFSKMAYPAIGTNTEISINWEATKMIDYEVEMAIIIGKEGYKINSEDVEDYIFGYTIINDVSARDVQMDHIQWLLGKSHNGFCPMGPAILHKSQVEFPPKLEITSEVNGEIRQKSYTNNLIFDIPYIISDLSKGVTLFPGDIIITGTPSGVGMGFNPPRYLKNGDVVTCKIEKIGELINVIR